MIAALVLACVVGIASWVPARFGDAYLALPQGPGIRVRVCGPAHCRVMTSTDAGPSLAMQRAGRVADIGVSTWEYLTGLPRGEGLAPITVSYRWENIARHRK